ncbi:MAG: twin arginine-targeting protein translocase TatC [Candidatus Fraserbacteria bacterium RBG_16_55_9]|uniref:Sec-independent protein translocase protein TatC n=1 Tax=Fraserbacteria sp. (strain RBG_16_55_9) TaxID=1817864 RepID=A0A1F5UT01_FRAXR|nr:MAG: twin arginine-targeting protein translocase TatC [Candidatus Fraserbacteria bacterium RBG_16_55_9]
MVDDSPMTLSEHLDDLRKRLVYALSTVVALAILAYTYKDLVMALLLRPFYAAVQNTAGAPLSLDQLGALLEKIREWLTAQICNGSLCFSPVEVEATVAAWRRFFASGSGLIFTHPTEAFFGYIKLSFFVGLLVGMPIVLYQIWRFVVPALYQKERKYIISFLVFGSALFYSGAAYCFWVILPLALTFLVGVGQPYLVPLFTLNNYISFVMFLMLIFGLCFEVPLVMYLVVKIGLVQHQTLVKQWRMIILGAFVVAAVLTPTPDMVTQVALGGSMIVLYLVGLVLTRFAHPRSEAEVVVEKSG